MTTDSDKVFNLFKEMTVSQITKAYKHSLYEGGIILKTKTIETLKQKLPKSTEQNPKYKDTLIDAIHLNIAKSKKNGEPESSVHVLGSRETGSGTFRTRFFEGGTVERLRKTTKTSLGKIKPLNFFNESFHSVGNQVTEKIIETLSETIKQINQNNV